MHNVSFTALSELFLQETPLIDVRAPVEYVVGALPGSVNLPIMNDEERALVGTTYKQVGREKAIALGHQLISGEVKEARLQQWAEQIRQYPEAVLYCFRGGLRSQITQRWLSERGIERPLIEGGYKRARQFLREKIDEFAKDSTMLVISGPTGSAKTRLLNQTESRYPNVDLESLASHRGSAFGGRMTSQPSQIDFENALAVKLLKLTSLQMTERVLVEDESRMIGHCAIPESFFLRMRASELLYVEESFEQRVENIFQEYVLETAIGKGSAQEALLQFGDYRRAVMQISKKLGGVRAAELLQDIQSCEEKYLKDAQDLEYNKAWISKLLSYYYDPLYASSLAKRSPKILLRGNAQTILEYIGI